jgi:hypothetical protein
VRQFDIEGFEAVTEVRRNGVFTIVLHNR